MDSAEERWLEKLRERRRAGAYAVATLEDIEQLIADRDAAIARAKAAERERDEARAHTSTAAFMRIERERDAALARAKDAEAERDAARILCDGCADAEIRTGSAHYTDCPVNALIVERDAAREEVARLRAVVDAARASRIACHCAGNCLIREEPGRMPGAGVCSCGGAKLRAALAVLDTGGAS